MTSPRVPEEDIASGRSPVVVVPDAIGAGDALPLSDADLVQLRLDLDAQLANLLPVQAVPASAAVPPAGSPNVASYVGKNSKAIPTVSRFDQVTLRGGRLTADVGSVVTDMTLSMSMDAVAQLTVTIIDKGYVKLGSGIFAGKPTMTYDGLALKVAGVEIGNSSGIPTITVKARSAAVERLKGLHSTNATPFVLRSTAGRDASAALYVKTECDSVKLPVVVKPTPAVVQVSRDNTPYLQPTTLEAPDQIPSAYTTIQRLAGEYGYKAFEAGNVFYFCPPSYLFEKSRVVRVHFGPTKGLTPKVNRSTQGVVITLDGKQVVKTLFAKGPADAQVVRIIDPPTGNWSSDAREVTVTFDVDASDATRFLPGYVVELTGVPYFGGTYLCNSVDYNLSSDRATVTIGTPIDLPPSNPGGLVFGLGNAADAAASLAVPGEDASGSAGDRLGLPVCGITMGTFLRGLRMQESGGDYNEHGNPGFATGAYQFEGPRGGNIWLDAAGGVIAQKYPEAYLAPREVQDFVAQRRVQTYHDQFGGDWAKVAVAWPAPAYAGNPSIWKTTQVAGTGGPTAYQYALNVLRYAGGTICSSFTTSTVEGRHTKSASDFLAAAMAQTGKPYVLGGPIDLNDPSPRTFDCSELVAWAAGRVGVSFPAPSGTQYQQCARASTLISVSDALNIRGAILFKGAGGSEHVAISLGDGKRDMAAHTANTDIAHQISVSQTQASYWDSAGLVPGMNYETSARPSGTVRGN